MLPEDIKLKKLYKVVGDNYTNEGRFNENLLAASRKIFEKGSDNQYVPKKFNVEAVLSGLPFSLALQDKIYDLQNRINNLIDCNHRYWVKPENLGIEYFVTKWPDDNAISSNKRREVISFIDKMNLKEFDLSIRGYQVNPDGVIVLKGYDAGVIRKVRSKCMSNFEWLPKKQSQWVHIPIGRILENISIEKHKLLIKDIIVSESGFIFNEVVKKIHYIKESRWYMESKEYVSTVDLK